MSYNSNVLLFMCFLLFTFFGCTINMSDMEPASESEPKPEKQKQKQKQKQNDDDPARKFMGIHNLGRQITSQTAFDDFLAILPDYFTNNISKSRVYLTRIDDFSIGNQYNANFFIR